jgi:plastocyanin
MRKLAVLGAVAATGVATSAVAAPPPAARDPRPATPIGIAEREYRISTYRKTVKPGPVKFNVTNFGEDTHNLVVTGPRRFRVVGPDVGAGERASLTVTLRRPGTYMLLCTRANHLSLGMRAKLAVRR